MATQGTAGRTQLNINACKTVDRKSPERVYSQVDFTVSYAFLSLGGSDWLMIGRMLQSHIMRKAFLDINISGLDQKCLKWTEIEIRYQLVIPEKLSISRILA